MEGFSTVEGYLQYCRGITAVHVGDGFSTVGVPSVLWRLFSTVADNISTVGDSFSTVKSIQYIGGRILFFFTNSASCQKISQNISKSLVCHRFKGVFYPTLSFYTLDL